MDIKQAYELAIAKWEYLVEFDYDGVIEHHRPGNFLETQAKINVPGLLNLFAGCSYCELFNNQKRDECYGCPLDKTNNCKQWDSLYQQWYDDPTAKKAKEMLEMIRLTKPEEP